MATRASGRQVRPRRATLALGLAIAAGATGGLLTARAAGAPAADSGDAEARAFVERALDLMGGAALEAVTRVRFDMTTQWQRTGYRNVPWTDRPSFEPHVDVRDYTIPAWRNTRDFGAVQIVNVVRDSVAITDTGEGFRPQSVAYVDERDELFVYTPDRLVLRLRDAPDLASAGDTLIGGERHALVRATVAEGFPVTVAFHAGTGLPTLLRFRRGHPNDFGLVPFGAMEVEVWYSAWRSFGDVAIPTQWDVQRAGAPYKRMTVRAAAFDPDLAPDSFSVPPALREAYLAARRPMHDRPVDSVRAVTPGLLQVHGFGFPAGAVRVGDAWVLLEAGHAPLSLERGRAALAAEGAVKHAAAVVAAARPGNGGVASLVEEGVPVYTSAAAEPFLEAVLAGAGVARRGVTVVREGRWLELPGGRLRLEPVDLPDVPGSLLVYAPDLRWVWAPDAVTPLDVRLVLERAEALGWPVSTMGTPRGMGQAPAAP